MMQVRELWAATRADLPKVTTPVIVFHSTEDHVVEPVNTQVLLDGVSSSDTTEVVLRDSYHVATLDNDAPLIFTGSVDWMRARSAGPQVPPADSPAAETR
jgi:carboxylesterase